MNRSRLALLLLASSAGMLLAACGSDAAPSASAESESPPAELTAETQPGVEGNQRPVITSLRFDPERPGPTGSVRVMVDVSDPDGDPIGLSYTWRLNGKLLRVSGDSLALGEARKGDTLEVTVAAGDGHSVSAPQVLSVALQNRLPEVKVLRLVPEDGVPPGGRLYVVAEVYDADGDPVELAYTWIVNGRSVSGDGPKLQQPVGRGDFVRVRVVASDGEDEAEPVELPEVEIANAAPWIDSEPGAPGPDGVFRYRVSADDIDHDTPLRFSLEQAPEGMTVNERSGLVQWSPGSEQAGRHRIEIAVRDSRGASGTQSFELVVGGAPAARQGG